MNQVLPILVATLAGTVVGALIAWLLTHLYARLALREMRKKLEQFERYNSTLTNLLKSWEDRGQIELSRNARGEITGGRVSGTEGTATLANPSSSGAGGASHRA